MFYYMKTRSTKTKGWQKLYWELAQTGMAFEVPEIELKMLLQKITNSKMQPHKEIMSMCVRYVGLCLERENLSVKAMEFAERILSFMEFEAKH
jgi:hypothetical protein